MEKHQVTLVENIVLCIIAAILGSMLKNIFPDQDLLWAISYLVIFCLLYIAYRWIRTKYSKKSKRP